MTDTDAVPTPQEQAVPPSSPSPSPSSKRILVLASYQYLEYAHVIAHLTALAPATFAIASQIGVGHSLLRRTDGHTLDVEPLKWQPTRPHLEVKADSAILFWDGHDTALLPSVMILKKASVPTTIIGPDGNAVDLARFCATLTNGNGDSAKMTTAPAVIVDAPVPQGARDNKVNVRIAIPESTYTQYEQQAKQAKQSVEKVLSDRLRTSVTYTSGRGLYFTDEQRSHLERITGGHIITDAAMALDKIRVTVELQVAGFTIELSDRILARAASRAKSERKSLEEYVRKEVIQGLERATGLRPW